MISPSLSRDIRQVVMKAKHGLALRSVVPLRHSLSFVGFWKLTLKAMYVRNYKKYAKMYIFRSILLSKKKW